MSPTIDPNRFASLSPLTPRELLERIGTLQDAAAKATDHADALKTEAKAETKAAEEHEAAVQDLVRCFRMGRPVYALVDGTFTTETPKGLDLWEAAATAAEKERTQADAASYVEPIHEHFGVGKVKDRGFVRDLKTGARLLVWAPKAGAWVAKLAADEVPGGPWRSAADAMLAALAASKSDEDARAPELGWNPTKDLPTAEKAEAAAVAADPLRYLAEHKGRRLSVTLERGPGGVTGWRARCATGEDVVHEGPEFHEGRAEAMEHALAMTGWKAEDGDRPTWAADPESIPAQPAKVAKASKASKAKRAAATPDDGRTFRATWGERTLAVAQVVSPGPWFAYADAERIGEAAGYATPDEAKAAVEAYLHFPAGSKLGWIGALGAADAPAPTKAIEAPKPESVPAPKVEAATPLTTGADRAAEGAPPRRRTRAASTT